MTTEATILLVGGTPPLGELMVELEEAGLFVEVASPRDLPSSFEVVQPDLVVHIGATAAHATVAFLQSEARTRRLVRVVLVGERAELSSLRRLDRHVVQSVLALDIPHRLIVERIRGLAQRGEGDATLGGQAASAGLTLDRLTPPPPPQSPEEKLRAWVQSSRPPVITEMDEADEHLTNRWEGTHEFAPYVDVMPASLDEEDLPPPDSDDPEGDRETLVVDSLLSVVSDEGETVASTGSVADDAGLSDRPTDEDARPTLPLDEDARPTVALLPNADPQPSDPSRGVPSSLTTSVTSFAAKVSSGEAQFRGAGLRSSGFRGAGPSWGGRIGVALVALALVSVAGWSLRSSLDGPVAHPSPVAARLEAVPPESGPDVPAPDVGAKEPMPSQASPTVALAAIQSRSEGLWVVSENPKIQSCEQLVPNRADLRLGDTDQSSRYWKKARGFLLLGDVDSALVALCQATLVFPAGLVTEALIEHLLSLGAPRAAEPFMARARSDRPNRPRTIELAGDVACQLGNAAEARTLWLRALGLEAPSVSTLQQVARQIAAQAALVRTGGQIGYAERLYRRVAILDGTNAGAWRALAEIEKERGHVAKALEFEGQIRPE